MGGYKVQGKSLSDIEQLMRDAVALDRAGVACIYLEGIPREVAAMITAEVSTPTIGIGAGPECDGQVLVFHDILNLTFGSPAKFVRRYADAAALITHAGGTGNGTGAETSAAKVKSSVILSGVAGARSAAAKESKDP
jgi:3-methyl-2-oxobutanoate hydroxymethyltransferase